MPDKATEELCTVIYSYLDGHSVGDMLELIAIVIQTAEYENGKMVCPNCARNAENGGEYPDGRSMCPIQNHYALLKDGHCHLFEMANCLGGKNEVN